MPSTYWMCVSVYPRHDPELSWNQVASTWLLCTWRGSVWVLRSHSSPLVRRHAATTVFQSLALRLDSQLLSFSCLRVCVKNIRMSVTIRFKALLLHLLLPLMIGLIDFDFAGLKLKLWGTLLFPMFAAAQVKQWMLAWVVSRGCWHMFPVRCKLGRSLSLPFASCCLHFKTLD